METASYQDTFGGLPPVAVFGPRLESFKPGATCSTFCWPVPVGEYVALAPLVVGPPRVVTAPPEQAGEMADYATGASPTVLGSGPRLVEWELPTTSQWSTTKKLELEPVAVPSTKVERCPSARPFWTDRVEEAVEVLLLFIAREARKHGVPVDRVEIRGYRDPEGWNELVVEQFVELPAEPALAYWDQLAAAFENWLENQPPRIKRSLDERIRLSVDWTTDESTT